MDQLRRIISPVQVAKFFVWTERHQESIKTLTTLMDEAARSEEDRATAGSEHKAVGEHVVRDEQAVKDEVDCAVNGDLAEGEAINDVCEPAPPPLAPSSSLPPTHTDVADLMGSGMSGDGVSGGSASDCGNDTGSSS